MSRVWRVDSPDAVLEAPGAGVHGWPAEKKYQRRASAPWVSKTCHGSTTLPLRLRHLLARRRRRCRPRHTTLRYGVVAEHERVDREQRVEPAAGLVDGLADEVGGEAPAVERRRRPASNG